MRTHVDILAHDLAVVDALETVDGGTLVGFAAAPDGALSDLIEANGPDYMILYPLPGGLRDGPLGDPYADAESSYQVTVVGASAAGVRHLVSLIEPALVAMTVEDRAVTHVDPEDTGGVRLDADIKPDHAGPGVFVATPRYRVVTTPAA